MVWGFWAGRRLERLFREFYEAGGEFGAGAGVFVHEEDVGVGPGLPADLLDPGGELFVGVLAAAEAEVAPLGGGDDVGEGAVVAVVDAEGAGVLAEEGEGFVVEPAGVAEFEGDRGRVPERGEELVQPWQIFFEISGELEVEGALVFF